MRLDKFLCDCNIGTRSQVKDLVKKGMVQVNGTVVKKSDIAINEDTDIIEFKGERVSYRKYVYILLNKPAGIITATEDKRANTVMDLIKPLPVKDMFPVGRLDKDTTGLLLITNDGDLTHKLLSPKYHVDKTYIVTTAKPVSQSDIEALCKGVDIGDDKPTLPAKASLLPDGTLELIIHEGRYHQVKRMLEAVDNEVTALHRSSFGPLNLENGPESGCWRELTQDEISKIIIR
ncbi:MAG: rRNA pseudouridine synthase [Lachnospiraceae bacterium]|nr:rRNA pseudouridine synthase [Lachnospiraceae bacterium]